MRAILPPLFALGVALAAWGAPLAAGSPAPGALAASPGFAAESAALRRLADRLRRIEEDGLDPAAYAIPPDALARQDPVAFQAALQRAATLALADLLHGRVREMPGRADIRRDTALVPLGSWLNQLAASPDPARVIDRAALATPDAAALKAALARARAEAAAATWAPIPGGVPNETIEPGVQDPLRVPPLRARLLASDPLLAAAAADPASPDYDDALVAAVRRFQEAQGLETDGRVGRITLAALNRRPEALVRQLRVALDMRRAAAPPSPERRIEVNIPHQRLAVLDGDDRKLLEMAVIVGKPARQTPMLRVRLTAVQFNPPWGVPERNAKEDLLPKLRRDPRALMEKGFRIYAFRDGERVEIDPTTVDWRSVSVERFPYVIRQDAGEANALGRIKFVMPNNQDIFMHDTPDRGLFRRPDRAFSSGCIRLERPMDLLEIVLAGTPGWDRARAQQALDSRQTVGVTVARTLPVRLHYTTIIVERGGEIRMRGDIYGLDEAYARAMEAGLSRPGMAAGQGGAATSVATAAPAGR